MISSNGHSQELPFTLNIVSFLIWLSFSPPDSLSRTAELAAIQTTFLHQFLLGDNLCTLSSIEMCVFHKSIHDGFQKSLYQPFIKFFQPVFPKDHIPWNKWYLLLLIRSYSENFTNFHLLFIDEILLNRIFRRVFKGEETWIVSLFKRSWRRSVK